MNSTIISGRLTADPKVTYTQEKNMCIARYTLAVDRAYKKEGGQTADFIPCVAMGRNGEFAERYLAKGIKIIVSGHIQTGSYTNKDGNKVYTTDVIVDRQEFCESKTSAAATSEKPASDGFMNAEEVVEEDDLPFR